MKKLLVFTAALAVHAAVSAQLCRNTNDTVYGLTAVSSSSPVIAMGQITALNVNNAGSVSVGGPASSALSANAMGISQLNGLFYFFNRCGPGASAIEFVSFNPLTGSKMALSNPPLVPATQRIRSGTVNRTGNGYYMIYPGATTAQGYPITAPALYYYNIPLNSWTLITQNFLNSSGTTVADIATLNSGDMAFDGNDNLWMLCSNTLNYALYRIRSPLPTTAVASVTVDTMIAERVVPVSGVAFTGIAFNAAGRMYLSTGSGGSAGSNRLYSLASVSSPLVSIGTVPNSFGDDLTSCIYPVNVLGIQWLHYSATLSGKWVKHQWDFAEDHPGETARFIIESSANGQNWKKETELANTGVSQQYETLTPAPATGRILYRIRAEALAGNISYSPQRAVSTTPDGNPLLVFPNPAGQTLFVESNQQAIGTSARICDINGRFLKRVQLINGVSAVDIGSLQPGIYFLSLEPDDRSNTLIQPVKFIKR